MQNGKLQKTHNGFNIIHNDYKVGINIGWNENGVKKGNNQWVVTAFDNSKKQSEKYGSNATSFTKEAHSLNSTDIIPQNTASLKNPNDIHYKQESTTKGLLEGIREQAQKVNPTNKGLSPADALQAKANASTTKQGALGSFTSKSDFKQQNNSITKNTDELDEPTTDNFSVALYARDDGFFKQQKGYILEKERGAKELDVYAKRFEKEGDMQTAKVMQSATQEHKKKAQKLRDELLGVSELRNYKPLSEFGTNYIEFMGDGEGAIQKLLEERQGQVAGAFYKEGLGDIDLVWGEVTDARAHKGYGLAHILDKRKAEFIEKGFTNTEAEHKTLELIKKIPSVIDNGKIVDLKNGKIRIVTEDYTIGMKNEWHDNQTNPYILTTFENNKKSDKNLHSTAFTKGETLPLNSTDIIPQTKLQSNVHIGSGLASGSVAGFETDEQGNLNFNPTNFLLGLAGGALGSKAIAKGFKAISKNPELKAKVTKELADTLSKGWDSAVKQYPILESLQPRYIVKNEKGRDLQAKHILRELRKRQGR